MGPEHHATGAGGRLRIDSCTEAFRGAIFATLGAAPDVIEPGRMVRFSTSGRRGDTAGWCKLFDSGDIGVFGDFRAGMSEVWVAKSRDRMTPAERAAARRAIDEARAESERLRREQWARTAPRLAALITESTPIAADGAGDDPVTRYLRNRLALVPDEPLTAPAALRLHPALEYWHEGQRAGCWPAMLAELHALDGKLVSLHQTWLTDDGRKAPTPGPCKKLTFSAGPVIGSCIRLVNPAEWASPVLGVAEGLETALAARCASGVPTVAAYSAGALAGWCWPPTLRRLVIFADADPTGTDAAEHLRQRARKAGLSVQVLAPSTPGMDWADVWSRRAEVTQ